MIRPNTFKMADYMLGTEASAQKLKNWAYCGDKCLVEIWYDERYTEQQSRGGSTRYMIGWGGAARPLKP